MNNGQAVNVNANVGEKLLSLLESLRLAGHIGKSLEYVGTNELSK